MADRFIGGVQLLQFLPALLLGNSHISNDNAYEFIEIFNASTTDTVSLFGWRFGDRIATNSFGNNDFEISPLK